MNVYPNPSSGIFAVELLLPKSKDAAIEVFDLSGRKIYGREIRNAFREAFDVDLRGFSAGMYLLKIETNSEKEFRKILIVR